MLCYDIDPQIEAFSTCRPDSLDFDVVLPQMQAHSVRVAKVPGDDTFGVDALITNQKGLRIGVKTADCVPVLMYDAANHAIAAVHSGWKGSLSNIIACALDRMKREYGTSPAQVKAVVGPCIHQPAYEVGDELHELFSHAGYGGFLMRMPRFGESSAFKWHLDLPGVCRAQLKGCGVDMVEMRGECTYALHHLFFSARRLGEALGSQRIITCIVMK